MLKGITYCTLLQQQCQRFQKSNSSPQKKLLVVRPRAKKNKIRSKLLLLKILLYHYLFLVQSTPPQLSVLFCLETHLITEIWGT